MAKRERWPVGTVVQAMCVIIDGDKDEMRITARPGELGIVFTDYGNGAEVMFSGGCFTTGPGDAAVKLYDGPVSTVCDGQSCHPAQAAKFRAMK